jgi:hypothetical protein
VFLEVARAVAERMTARLAARGDDRPDLESDVRRFVANYRSHARMIALMEQLGMLLPDAGTIWAGGRGSWLAGLEETVRRQQADGSVDLDPNAYMVVQVLGRDGGKRLQDLVYVGGGVRGAGTWARRTRWPSAVSPKSLSSSSRKYL